MPSTETIQFRVPVQMKEDFAERCERKGITVSEGARDVLEEYLYGPKSPVDELDAIFADADEKLEAAALPEPSIEEVNAYCAKVRSERASQMLVS